MQLWKCKTNDTNGKFITAFSILVRWPPFSISTLQSLKITIEKNVNMKIQTRHMYDM